ncbi:MAG: 2-C-methyl-D-erythritol 2,4-cyclodiphosphate synthase [Nitrospirae bacterium]|nr:MAG: 2-C-methyl-D-erythritol 2,4-cyclodiphosphate synthase [Nitrospirota bacterium]
MFRIGIGYDSHRLSEGRRLIIGGVDIPFHKGLLGHSDGDLLCHAIMDAIIGALGRGDIGKHFPDSHKRWKDASSIEMLSSVIKMMEDMGFELLWMDTTVVIERPKLSPYMEDMKRELSKAGIHRDIINIKAKTSEGMGFVGRGEGAEAHAVCLLKSLR